MVDDRDRVAELLGHLELVRAEDEGLAPIAHLEEGGLEQRDVDRVEPGERLVHQDHVGVVEDGRDELHLLLVPLRERLGPPVGDIADPESPEPRERVRARPAPRDVVERREEHELVEHAHPPVQAALLGHVAPGPSRPVRRLAVEPGDGSLVGAEQAEDDPHRRRLPGAVRAEEAEHLAAFDREGDAVERLNLPEPLLQPLDSKTHARPAPRPG